MNTPQFTNTWFQANVKAWTELFQNEFDTNKVLFGVEIGVFEGQSTCWIADNVLINPKSKLICIDTFRGSIEHSDIDLSNLESIFRKNIETTGKANQIKVMKSSSYQALLKLNIAQVQVDFIYVDGSHEACDVLSDAILSYNILKPGGIIIFDDYIWRLNNRNPIRSPKIAIDSFLTIYYNKIEPIMLNSYQIYVRKVI